MYSKQFMQTALMHGRLIIALTLYCILHVSKMHCVKLFLLSLLYTE